jgi:type II secretory pathway pseudopilin PulG
MRAVLGVVSLLVVLAVIGVLATKQLRTIGRSVSSASPQEATPAASATVREQSQQLQQRVRTDVTRALEQGAARSEESAK